MKKNKTSTSEENNVTTISTDDYLPTDAATITFLNPFSIPIGGMTIKAPVNWSWDPKEDITTYELAQLIPYTHGKALFEEDIKENPELFRHINIY